MVKTLESRGRIALARMGTGGSIGRGPSGCLACSSFQVVSLLGVEGGGGVDLALDIKNFWDGVYNFFLPPPPPPPSVVVRGTCMLLQFLIFWVSTVPPF